jgi:hypothetical protein
VINHERGHLGVESRRVGFGAGAQYELYLDVDGQCANGPTMRAEPGPGNDNEAEQLRSVSNVVDGQGGLPPEDGRS